ncbi:MAG: integrase family protein [Burkholderiaceae bacterium]|jgi:integrase|nr:integrase family protein [Burkholderiaceae bacterium]
MAAKLTDAAVQAAIKKAIKKAKEIEKAAPSKEKKAPSATVWKHESRGRGAGALSLKAAGNGRAHWYFRYALDRKNQYVPIGPYGKGADELTLQAARARCDELAVQRAAVPTGDLRGSLAVQEAAREAEHRQQVQAVQQAPSHSLAALMDVYADALDARGKGAAGDVRGITKRHIVEPFSQYAEAPARELTQRQAVEIIRRVVERGNGRTAGKLRSYLRAAFALALRAESDASAPSKMLGFNIESNPVAGTVAMPQFNRTRERALSEDELRALWKRLTATDTPSSLAIRLAVLLGGQRVEQLIRTNISDVEGDTITLYDPKGRRTAPRVHVLPIGEEAGKIITVLKARAEAAASPYLFPADEAKPMNVRTVSKYMQSVRKTMTEAKETTDFLLADVRRTCETRMAELGVSKDLRAQIQSHGLGGVQDRHYDRYEYLKEKRIALDAWAAWLAGGQRSGANVVGIKTRSKKKAA